MAMEGVERPRLSDEKRRAIKNTHTLLTTGREPGDASYELDFFKNYSTSVLHILGNNLVPILNTKYSEDDHHYDSAPAQRRSNRLLEDDEKTISTANTWKQAAEEVEGAAKGYSRGASRQSALQPDDDDDDEETVITANTSINSAKFNKFRSKDKSQNSLILNRSNVLKSLNSLPRLMDQELRLLRERQRHNADKFTKAMELQNHASKVLDRTRLHFEAAVLFDEIDATKLAIKNYQMACDKGDSAAIVDLYDLPKSVTYERKIERMGTGPRAAYLRKREVLRDKLIFMEDERQRLRAVVSSCQLFRLFLVANQIAKAQQSIQRIFAECKSAVERAELLWYIHSALVEHLELNPRYKELSNYKQVLYETGGPIADTHIAVLLELLEENGSNPEVHHYLGFRYSQKCDFKNSVYYYMRERVLLDLRGEESGMGSGADVANEERKQGVAQRAFNQATMVKVVVERYSGTGGQRNAQGGSMQNKFLFSDSQHSEYNTSPAMSSSLALSRRMALHKIHDADMNPLLQEPEEYIGTKNMHNTTTLYVPPSIGWG